MKRAFLAVGPIASAFVVVILLASTAADAQARPGTQLDPAILVHGGSDLCGHSFGTFAWQSHLVPTERAAEVAHGVNVDGGAADALPSGVLTVARGAGAARETQGEIVRTISVTTAEQEHVVVAPCPASFVENASCIGKEPATSEIVPPFSPWIPAPEGAAIFPENAALFIPANPLGTASTEGVRRALTSTTRTSNVRNFPSTERRVSVELDDYG